MTIKLSERAREVLAELAKRPEVILITKIEGLDDEVIKMQTELLSKVLKKSIKSISYLCARAYWRKRSTLGNLCLSAKRQEKAEIKKDSETIEVIRPDFKELEWSVKPIDEDTFWYPRSKNRAICYAY